MELKRGNQNMVQNHRCRICLNSCSGTIKIFDKRYSIAPTNEAIVCNACYMDWCAGNFEVLDVRKIHAIKREVEKK